jgi:hypothetical protein
MASDTKDGNGEGEAMGSGHFWRGRGRGGEAAPQCQRWMMQRRAARRPGRPKVAADEKLWLRV